MSSVQIPYLLPTSEVSPRYNNGYIIHRKCNFPSVISKKYTDIMKSKGILVIDENSLSRDATKYIAMNEKYYLNK